MVKLPLEFTVCGNEEVEVTPVATFDQMVFRPNAKNFLASGTGEDIISVNGSP